jgi:asparagine synthase (glutamine-hydrolysing)
MCGIVGIYGHSDRPSARERVRRMSSRLAHRGPDAEGHFDDEFVAMSHRRLSILDLSRGANQPMSDPGGRYTLVYNGEIYNYRELRNTLPDYTFRSSGDTEVLLAGLVTHGLDFVKRCNGMFAFALWDAEEEKLFLCRDRLGIKPLYYLRRGEEIYFASEIRSILAGLDVSPQLNTNALAEYLRFQTVHGPSTILEGVFALPPGSFMEIADNEQQIKYFFKLTEPDDSSGSRDYSDVCHSVKELLSQAVKRRLVSDVPLGVFLSGGIDSSAVVALAAPELSRPLKTFTITFAEKEYSEAPYAEAVARKYETDHHTIELKPERLIEKLPDALRAMDHPTGDGINTFVISEVAKDQGITVALSGLGGDEVFAGYPIFTRFMELQKKKWILSFPKFSRDIFGAILEKRNPGIASSKIRSVLNQDRFDLEYIYPFSREVATPEQNASLLSAPPKPENSVYGIVEEGVGYGKPGFRLPLLSQVSYAEMSTYLPNVLLRDTDQMSMAHALEVRVPFLDHELVSYVMGVPDKFKYPASPKKLLVDALEGAIPSNIVNRPKMGFTFPWEEWMRKELKPFCIEMIDGLAKREAFDGKRVRKRFEDFLNGNVTFSRIWHLCVLEAWLRENEID